MLRWQHGRGGDWGRRWRRDVVADDVRRLWRVGACGALQLEGEEEWLVRAACDASTVGVADVHAGGVDVPRAAQALVAKRRELEGDDRARLHIRLADGRKLRVERIELLVRKREHDSAAGLPPIEGHPRIGQLRIRIGDDPMRSKVAVIDGTR